MLFGGDKKRIKYEVVNLFDARQSPGSVSGSRTFDRPVYVDKVYMSWFRSYNDYKATVTVKVTLEDDTQRTIYSISNSEVIGGENAVLNVNSKIKAIRFEMFSGSVGGNGIGYQLTFLALKNSGVGRLNLLKSLLLRDFSTFSPTRKTVGKEVSNMLFGGSKSRGNSAIPAGYKLKFGSLAKAEIANVIPVAIKMSNYQHETSRTGETSYGSCTMYATGGNKTLLRDYTRMAGNWHLTEVSGGVFWLPAYFGTDGLHFEELKTITGFSGSPTIVAWLERTGGGR